METVVVKLKKETLAKLERLKEHERETCDEVINRLMSSHKQELDETDVSHIMEGLRDVKAGRVFSSDQMEKELGM